MKQTISYHRQNAQVTALILVIAILCSYIPIVSAAEPDNEVVPAASQYITSYRAGISIRNGSLVVDFSITANGTMTSLGATKISIYESDGTHVKTFYSATTSGMLKSNSMFHAGTVSHSNYSSSTSYYAKVYFKAANSSGSDTATYIAHM